VIPMLLILFGFAAFTIGAVILRSFGPGYRVGRLLAATRSVSLADAVALAGAGGPGEYVKVTGRIDAETDFEDDAHRPLVFRRTRLDVRIGRRWQSVDDHRQAVPFELAEGLDQLAVQHEDLDEGLVVLPRESMGTAADVIEQLPPGSDPTLPVRLLVQQVSSVEHAIVVGVPSLDAAGKPVMTAGRGRPLILTTLETGEAMRILAGDHPRRPLMVAISLVVGLGLTGLGLLWAAADVIL
jgi:hypothetical protein